MQGTEQAFTLQRIQKDQSNLIIPMNDIKKTHTEFNVCEKGFYFPYNYEFKDQGWGCAWRAIQLLLSSQNIIIPFEGLYLQFSQKQQLLAILKQGENKSQKLISYLQNNKWAPSEISCHWAEPFIGSLVCTKFKIKHQLLLVNGYPNAYAPACAFTKIIKFQQLLTFIKTNISTSSIMIDDGTYSLSIIGYHQVTEQSCQLLFADPHMKSNIQCLQVGIYSQLFLKNGRNMGYKLSDKQIEQSLYNVFEKLDFQNKFWMICVIQQ